MRSVAIFAVVLCMSTLPSIGAGEAAAQGAGDEGPGITIYPENLGLVRVGLERRLEAGEHRIRVDGLPAKLEASSLVVVNDGVVLRSVSGLRTYEGSGSSGASVDLELDVARTVERLELAFLTSGLDWSAAYNMVVAEDDGSARFDGYAVLHNRSGIVYEDARIQLLAGQIARADRNARPRPMAARMEDAVTAEVPEVPFGDYHLYTLEETLTLRSGESRRERLFGAGPIPVEKQYTFMGAANYYQPSPEPVRQPVTVSYRLPRSDETEFGGTPLPAGSVHIYQPDEAGRLQLLGIASLPDTPAHEDLTLPTGQAFDLRGTRTQTEHRRLNGDTFESAWRVELRNETDREVTVRVIERMSGDWEILESTHTPERLSTGAVRFDVSVPAGGTSELEYTVRVRN